MSAPATEERSPYVGLVPYGERDADFFFGRSEDIAFVSANLRSSRLTIVYGPSGVGKSSLLQAGVVHNLREEARTADPDHAFAVCVVRSWLGDPTGTLEEAARSELEPLAGDEALPPPCATLCESLREWTRESGTLLVVLDQFEEYFQYHPGEGDQELLTGFAGELADVVNDSALPVNVLLSVREDALAKLDLFAGHIPRLFGNYLRIEHLSERSARQAITGPIAAWNRTQQDGGRPYEIEPALIDRVLEDAAGGLSLTEESE